MSVLFDPLEAVVRRALELDPDTRERVGELEGRVVEVVFTGIGQTLCVTVEQGSLSFSRMPEREPDLRLKGSPIAFGRYLMASDRVEITQSGIKIEGDIGLAQRFAGLLRGLDIDWEEWASRYVGDVAAHHAGRAASDFRAWARGSARQARMDVTELLQEETRLLAPRERIKRLMDDIDAARSDVERLEQRVRRLRNSP